jgi:hypothetical protein
MPHKLKDLRNNIGSIEQADAVFAEIARAEIDISKKKAQAEARIATIKKNLENQTSLTEQMLEQNRRRLTLYIESHPDQFANPRKRKTDWGRYGLQKSSRVDIYDEKAALTYAIRFALDCTQTKLDRPAVRKLVKDGGFVDGCEYSEGDIAHYTIAKSLLDEAKEEV